MWKPGAQVSMTGGLPIVSAQGQECPLWVVAAHGGAGATSWARLLGAGDAGVGWPDPSGFTRAVVVARNSFVGLRAAQSAAIQWASGQVERVELAGLVSFQAAWRAQLAWEAPVSREVRKVLKDLSVIGKEV